MSSIYANAYFTIVAAEGGDENLGLPGVSQERPRCNPFRQFDFIAGRPMYEFDPRVANWEKRDIYYFHRSWAFQERTLSRRRLVFNHQTVSWVCQSSVREETGHENTSTRLPCTWLLTIRKPSILSYLFLMLRSARLARFRIQRTSSTHLMPSSRFTETLCGPLSYIEFRSDISVFVSYGAGQTLREEQTMTVN